MISDYTLQAKEVIDSFNVWISDLKPSEWAENNIIMPKPFPGPLSYNLTPYTREIIDCFAPDHPAREIAVMGAAQFGKTASIIIPVIGYIIENDPGPIIMTVGHEDLLEDAMSKIDYMLDTTGLRRLIRTSAQRVKSQKTGDTNRKKEFPNGFLKLSSASNPKIWRQESYKFGLIDDYEAVKSFSKIAGSTRELIGKRFTAFDTVKKLLYISSPEMEQTSNIYEVYLLGDQRKFLIPCPCCGTFIELVWSTVDKHGNQAGFTWHQDDNGKVVSDSVGYICQECNGMFTDQNKSDYVNRGYWQPTATPFKPDMYSYHMPSWYSPHGMTDWEQYIYKYIECHPPGLPRIEHKYQTFLNLNAGWPYQSTSEAPKATDLMGNIRNYEINQIPEKLSEKDGNGKIVLITMACDLNGVLDDARLDYEVVGWSESGASYSITHGSIGTFIPREGSKKIKEDREKWSYEHNHQRSVWPEVSKLIRKTYKTDTDRVMEVFITAIDSGHYTIQAYSFLDKMNNARVVGVKGATDKYVKLGIDRATFKPAKERNLLYILEVGNLKDDLADLMRLKYDPGNDDVQPPGFMNFPTPSEGKYNFPNYFSHYEAEHKIPEIKNGETVAMKWEKKNSAVQNHFFDVRVYNMAARDILVAGVCKEMDIKPFTWADYCDIVLKRRK